MKFQYCKVSFENTKNGYRKPASSDDTDSNLATRKSPANGGRRVTDLDAFGDFGDRFSSEQTERRSRWRKPNFAAPYVHHRHTSIQCECSLG